MNAVLVSIISRDLKLKLIFWWVENTVIACEIRNFVDYCGAHTMRNHFFPVRFLWIVRGFESYRVVLLWRKKRSALNCGTTPRDTRRHDSVPQKSLHFLHVMQHRTVTFVNCDVCSSVWMHCAGVHNWDLAFSTVGKKPKYILALSFFLSCSLCLSFLRRDSWNLAWVFSNLTQGFSFLPRLSAIWVDSAVPADFPSDSNLSKFSHHLTFMTFVYLQRRTTRRYFRWSCSSTERRTNSEPETRTTAASSPASAESSSSPWTTDSEFSVITGTW